MRRPPPKSFCLASKQASPPPTPLEEEEEEEGSIHFTLYVSHPIASQPGGRGGRGEGTQLLERKRIHKKAAEPIPSHRTRYHRYQALRGRQKGREGAGTESPAAPAACKACPMHAGTSWSCSPTYEKEGREYADVSNKNFARDKNAIGRNINRGIKFRARPGRAGGPPSAPITWHSGGTAIAGFISCRRLRRLVDAQPATQPSGAGPGDSLCSPLYGFLSYGVSDNILPLPPSLPPSLLLHSRAGSIIELP